MQRWNMVDMKMQQRLFSRICNDTNFGARYPGWKVDGGLDLTDGG